MHTVVPVPVPLLPVAVSAGFPSPAAAYAAKSLVLDDWLWPSRASCQLVQDEGDRRRYLVLDQSLQPVVGDWLWTGEGEPLLQWSAESHRQVSGDLTGLVISASIQLFRRRPDPGHSPDSIHDWLVRRPHATYLVRAEGRSMIAHGIHHGSLLVVDRSCDLHDGDIVIAGCIEGFLVKQYRTRPARLVAGNSDYPDIVLERAPQYDLDGVVIASLSRFRGAS
ncbi:LexA family protein [Microbulbifer guangxiensis]|uniref:LexA family protein n=1 Tax=Microbulbifer guangxiensis TaxID=2904249 RepID=UPI003F72CCC8